MNIEDFKAIVVELNRASSFTSETQRLWMQSSREILFEFATDSEDILLDDLERIVMTFRRFVPRGSCHEKVYEIFDAHMIRAERLLEDLMSSSEKS